MRDKIKFSSGMLSLKWWPWIVRCCAILLIIHVGLQIHNETQRQIFCMIIGAVYTGLEIAYSTRSAKLTPKAAPRPIKPWIIVTTLILPVYIWGMRAIMTQGWPRYLSIVFLAGTVLFWCTIWYHNTQQKRRLSKTSITPR